MAAKKTSAGKAKAKQMAARSAEEEANQKVLQHYAKTKYFNDLWVSFLSKMAGLVVVMSYMVFQRMRYSDRGLDFTVGFEALSVLISISTVLFIRRWLAPLLAFKVAFAFSLLQAFWFAASYSSRFMELPRQVGDLTQDQVPFGTIYFVVCWASDRFMIGSQSVAQQTAQEMQEVVQKTKSS